MLIKPPPHMPDKTYGRKSEKKGIKSFPSPLPLAVIFHINRVNKPK